MKPPTVLVIFMLFLLQHSVAFCFANNQSSIFTTSFESVNDFNGFYLTKNGEYASMMSLSQEQVLEGNYSQKSWILSARDDNNDSQFGYLPHRAYPTIQLYKTPQGRFKSPTLTSIYVWLDIKLQAKERGHIDDWFSFATFSSDSSDNWNRVVLVNLVPDNYVRLVHVPLQGQQIHNYQATPINDPTGELKFPYREWVRLDIYLDFGSSSGNAIVWMNGKLISHACVRGGFGYLEQAHFGLYSSASISSGTIMINYQL